MSSGLAPFIRPWSPTEGYHLLLPNGLDCPAGWHFQTILIREVVLQHVGSDQAVASNAITAWNSGPLADYGYAAAQVARKATVGALVGAIAELAVDPDDDFLVEDDPIQH